MMICSIRVAKCQMSKSKCQKIKKQKKNSVVNIVSAFKNILQPQRDKYISDGKLFSAPKGRDMIAMGAAHQEDHFPLKGGTQGGSLRIVTFIRQPKRFIDKFSHGRIAYYLTHTQSPPAERLCCYERYLQPRKGGI